MASVEADLGANMAGFPPSAGATSFELATWLDAIRQVVVCNAWSQIANLTRARRPGRSDATRRRFHHPAAQSSTPRGASYIVTATRPRAKMRAFLPQTPPGYSRRTRRKPRASSFNNQHRTPPHAPPVLNDLQGVHLAKVVRWTRGEHEAGRSLSAARLPHGDAVPRRLASRQFRWPAAH